MLTHDSVSLVICHRLIRALLFGQHGLISPLLQQFVTLRQLHYHTETHHPRDNMQPHMSTQVAEVQELYRAIHQNTAAISDHG